MKNTVGSKILNIVGIILCILIAPMLIINCTLIIKSWVNPDAVPSVGGIFPMIVQTDSMNSDDPQLNIESGDLIICKTIDGETAEVGDVITFYDPDGNGTTTVTHKVVAKETVDGVTVYTTKGEANNTEDASQVKASDVIGKYLFRLKGMGNVALFMQSSAGLIVCVVLPILLFVLYDVLYRKSSKKEKNDRIAELEKTIEALKQEKNAGLSQDASAGTTEQSGEDSSKKE